MLDSGHDDASDYAHEYADGHEDVIYYAKAEELYHAATTDERDNAESMNEDCGGFPAGIDMAQRFTILAYWIIRGRIEEELQEAIEELEETLADLASDIESAMD